MRNHLMKIFVIAAIFIPLLSVAQPNRNVAYIGYPGFQVPHGHANSDYLIFDTLTHIANQYSKELNGSVYEFYVLFKIDTMSNVVDYRLHEITICEVPPIVKTSIEQLILSTNSKWLPQLKDYQKKISDELIWCVRVLQRNQSIEERAKQEEKFIDFNIGKKITDPVVLDYNKSGKRRFIIMYY